MKKTILLVASLLIAAVPAFSQTVKIANADKERAAELVGKMTLDEKIGLISGYVDGFHTYPIERLGIPSVRMADGPQGVRNKTNSTYYPCGISLAASFNRAVAAGVGDGIGYDAKARGVGIMLCPGVNIYRTALCGRNFEYFGEDPYLASETALNYINGIQSHNVVATIKHFALNNSEYDRHWTGSLADERTMNEIYFPTFRKAIEQGKVGAVMTSYNPVNGIHAAENAWLVKENLRAWGHKGIVMSDWKSTYTTYGCLTSGLDLEMPKAYELTPEKVKMLLADGMVEEGNIDEMCRHILQTFSAFGFLDKPIKDDSIPEDYEVSRNLAYKAAVEGPVLLKNNSVLPLKKAKKVVICGKNADQVAFGGGSGAMQPFPERNVSLYQAFCNLDKYKVVLSEDEAELKSASAVIVAVGFWNKTESEGSDRKYSLPAGQDSLILKAASLNKNVIVVINSGGEVDVRPWFDKVGAVIMAWYGGQEGGRALADIITGKVAPSGRLPFTFWGSLEANPAYPNYVKKRPEVYLEQKQGKRNRDPYPHSEYVERFYLGYRGVEHFNVQPMFPFGYGLSYSSFEYSDVKVVPAGEGFDVSLTVRNTGKNDSSECVQLYVAPLDSKVARPAKELKGFEKVCLAKGKSASVTIHLGNDAFSYYDTASHSWKVDACNYELQIGASSQDIRLKATVKK